MTKLLSTLIVALFICSTALAQQNTTLLKRSVTRHENVRFGYGGTVTILGAPKGSITIEGWNRSEVDLTADIEWQAETQADFDILAQVNNFAFDEDTNHLRLLTTGTHDREYLKKVAKNFPKRLLNLPWKIDFHLKVPVSTDIEIDAGHGPISLSGVEGALRLNATESETSLTLSGGMASVTIAAGNVNLSIPVKSWRGGGAEIRIASGILNVDLAPGFNGDIDADVLRAGKIENNYDGLTMREKPGITERLVRGRAGSGGAFFKFVVGDGVINFKKAAP
ncbi:MAG TPA: hypothetical protein VI306_09965 [Pyrinomonadaceae bacterium]